MTRIISMLPKPTSEEPYKQLDYLFNRLCLKTSSKNTSGLIKSAVNIYKKYLDETHDFNEEIKEKKLFFIDKYWYELSLANFSNWINDSCNNLTTNSKAKYISIIHNLMDYAFKNGFTDKRVIPVVTGRHHERETIIAEGYDPQEEKIIKEIIEREFNYIKRLHKPYVNKNIGRDPRNKSKAGLSKEDLKNKYGYSSMDNMIWYFEHILNSNPIHNFSGKNEHRNFYNGAYLYHGGVENFYYQLGISNHISLDIIMIHVIRLAYLTGLNPESIFSLKRDCLKIHPLTGKPFISFYKERSSGESESHITLLDKNELHLEMKTSHKIIETINSITKLTDKLVSSAENDDKDYLFLYQMTYRQNYKTALINCKVTSPWYKKFVKKYGLKDKEGNPLTFNLRRFRPTKLTSLFINGFSINDLKSIANHKSIDTTFPYFLKREVNKKFIMTMSKALVSLEAKAKQRKPEGFKTPVSSCINPHNPPKRLKNTNDFKEFRVCSSWSQCLLCSNILITTEHIPQIIAYRSQILVALNKGVKSMFTQSNHYENILSVIDELITEGNYFSKEELEEAHKKSEVYINSVIDDFIYQGIKSI